MKPDSKNTILSDYVMGIYIQQPFPKKFDCRSNQYRKCFIYLFISICFMSWVHLIIIPPSYASTTDPNDIFFSINVKQMPLDKVCKKILNKTEYEIIFDQRLAKRPITLKLDNVALSTVLKKIIKLAVIENYAIVQNNRQVNILRFESTTSNSGKYNGVDLDSDSMLESSSSDIGISLTTADMQALKKKSEENMNNKPKNTIVTPPSSSGKGLTVEELEALKQANKEKIENLPKNTVVTPPSDSGSELTLGDLEALKKAQEEKMENIPKDTIITPPSASGRGLTLEELEALQKSPK